MKKLLSFIFALSAVMASWGQSDPDPWTDPGEAQKQEWNTETVFYIQVLRNGMPVTNSNDIKVRGEVYTEFEGGYGSYQTRAVVPANSEYHNAAQKYFTELIVPGTTEERQNEQNVVISFLCNGVEYHFGIGEYVFDGQTHGSLSNLIVANIVDVTDKQNVTLSVDDMHLQVGQGVDVRDFTKVTYGNTTTPINELYPAPQFYVMPYESEYFRSGRGGLEAGKPTSRKGVDGMFTFQFGNGSQYGADEAPCEVTLSNKVFIEPFDFIADAKSISLTMDDFVLDLNSPKEVYIKDHIYLNIELCDEDAEDMSSWGDEFKGDGDGVLRFKLSEMPYDIEQRIDYGMMEVFEMGSNYEPVESECVRNNKKEETLFPLKGTKREGVSANYWLMLDGVTYQVFGNVKVTPFDRWDSYVYMTLSDVQMDLVDDKAGYDIRQNVSFALRADDWTAENKKFDVVAFDKLAETLGYMPTISFDVMADGKYVATAQGSTMVSPVRPTGANGSGVTLYARGGNTAAPMMASAKVYIVPFDLFDDNMTMTLPAIVVNKSETIDLGNLVTFHFTDPADDAEKALTYAAMKTAGYFVPNFVFSLAMTEDPETYGLYGQGLLGVKRTEGEPEKIVLRLATADGEYSYTAPETTVTVTLNYIAAESMKLVYGGQEVVDIDMERLTPYDIKIVLEPQGAVYEIGNFSFVEDNADVPGKKRHFFSYEFVNKDDGPYVRVTPLHAEHAMAFSVGFDDGEVQFSSDVTADVMSDMTIEPGWNWYSLYNMDVNPAEGMAIGDVDTKMFGGKMLDVRARTKVAYKDEQYGLFGSLKKMDNVSAYQVKTTATEAFTTYVNPAAQNMRHNAWTHDVVVTLNAGWNWLVFPYEFDRSLEICDVFPKTLNNRLISKDGGFATCMGNDEWVGSLEGLRHGESYLFYNAGDATTVTFPAECNLYIPTLDDVVQIAPMPSNRRAAKRVAASQWQYDHHAFADNMSIIGEIANVPDAANLTVGAYVGNECRGEGRIVEADGRQYLFITVHGQAQEEVSFCLGNGVTEFPLTETLPFAALAGTLDAPVRFVAPLSVPTAVPMVSAEGTNDAAVYDLQGRRVLSASHGVYIQNGKTVIR